MIKSDCTLIHGEAFTVDDKLHSSHVRQAFTVLVYSLEYLVKCKRLVHTGQEKTQFLQAQRQTRQLIQRLRSSNLSAIKKASLVFMEVDPCFVFAVGIRFRGLLERFL